MMTGEEYKMALAALGWTHEQAAAALGVTARTSFNYAARGAPRHIALALTALAARPKRGSR